MTRHLTHALIAVLMGSACTLAAAAEDTQEAQEAQGNWLVRLRAVQIDPANKSDAIPSLAVPANAITINDKTIPEVDISYFFTPHIAAELVLTVPQKQTVTVQQSALGGPVDIGTFKHLPPTLMLQYHFMPDAVLRPYVGAGVNYTRISSVNLAVPGVGPLSLQQNSFGFALGAGFDVRIAKNAFLNFDVKKVQISSDVRDPFGSTISTVKVDPWLYGVGIGYRF
jgi:outer membrane protein